MAVGERRVPSVSHWGIDPIPDVHRKLSGLDLAVLWGDLGVGVLVMATGALLVAPADQFGFGLSLPAATAAILLGSAIGGILLGLGGVIGTQEARPTMALLRPVLGTRGSWIPSLLNVAQLTGWTAVELWAMARIASVLGERLLAFSGFGFWLALFTVLTLSLTLWGPLGVVRTWMEKFGAWAVIAIGLAITLAILNQPDLGAVWTRGGARGVSLFGLPLDLVIAIPVSWIPLVADYNRFSKSRAGSFWGTSIGFGVANAWFYALGAVVLLQAPGVMASPEGIALGILSLAGVTVTGTAFLVGLVVGETDEAFADVYSGAVSLRNILPSVDNRILVVSITLAGALLAARFTMLAYELFLFLLGSVFVPLLGVWFADYFILKNSWTPAKPIRWESIIGWVAGFGVYHWIAPTPLSWWTEVVSSFFGSALSERLPWLGASLPSFSVAFLLHCLIGTVIRRNIPQGAGISGP
jgi:nucleobase:cation symporter-1, NCS1 family